MGPQSCSGRWLLTDGNVLSGNCDTWRVTGCTKKELTHILQCHYESWSLHKVLVLLPQNTQNHVFGVTLITLHTLCELFFYALISRLHQFLMVSIVHYNSLQPNDNHMSWKPCACCDVAVVAYIIQYDVWFRPVAQNPVDWSQSDVIVDHVVPYYHIWK